jgi:hypothetical protein
MHRDLKSANIFMKDPFFENNETIDIDLKIKEIDNKKEV